MICPKCNAVMQENGSASWCPNCDVSCDVSCDVNVGASIGHSVGWECPKCGAVMAPYVSMCWYCRGTKPEGEK